MRRLRFPKGWFFVLVVSCLLTVVPATPVIAQDVTYDNTQSWFGVRVGYLKIDEMEDEGSANLGFTSGLRFSDPLGIEVSLDYHSSDFSEINRTTYAFQCSLMLFLNDPTQPVQPYLLGGGGYYLSGYDYYSGGVRYTNFTTHKFGLHAGAGVDFWIGPNSSLTLDVRYLFVEEDAPDMDSVDGILATVGTKFRF